LSWFNKYWSYTRSPLYSFLFTIPLFLIYEIGILLTSSDDMYAMRNGADALIRQLLSTLGLYGFYWIGSLFLLGVLVVYFFHEKYWEKIDVHGKYLIFMMFESMAWSVVLYQIMANMHIVLMQPSGVTLIQQITLAVGAGIYEEILFRVILIIGISSILGFIFRWKSRLKNWSAMVVSAGIFSSFHFIGEYGDYFSFDIFIIRFFAGIVLGLLYFIRGFGITAWTHSIYDLIIVTRVTMQ